MDRRVGSFPVPPQLQAHIPGVGRRAWSPDIALAMREYLVVTLKESSEYIHV